MSENKQFFIRVDGQLVPVTEEVYREYYRLNRHERYLEEKDAAHKLIHYAAFDTNHSTGEEEIPDEDAEDVADVVTRKLMVEMLHKCLDLLPGDERALMEMLFFSSGGAGMTERECAVKLGISKTALHARKEKVFAKLRGLLENKLQNS